MKFTKMHGTGNDYVYLDCLEENIEAGPELAIKLSDRHFGVGGDGLILIRPSEAADFRMQMYNADGSEGKMCGNGIRCVAKYVYDRGYTAKDKITVETLSGVKTLWLNIENGEVKTVRADMGSPRFRPEEIPALCEGDDFIKRPIEILGRQREITALSVGNPHAVLFVKDADFVNIERLGPFIETHPIFPERINAEFVEVIDDNTLKMRVWERGSGETLACGTGATACLCAASICGYTGDRARLITRGGELFIEWDRQTDTLYMTGPAEIVFTGEIDI